MELVMFIEWSRCWSLNKAVSHAATSNYGATGAFFNKRIKTEKEPHAPRLHGRTSLLQYESASQIRGLKTPVALETGARIISQEKTPQRGRRSALRSLEAPPPSQQW